MKKRFAELLQPYDDRAAAAADYVRRVRPDVAVQTGELTDPMVRTRFALASASSLPLVASCAARIPSRTHCYHVSAVALRLAMLEYSARQWRWEFRDCLSGWAPAVSAGHGGRDRGHAGAGGVRGDVQGCRRHQRCSARALLRSSGSGHCETRRRAGRDVEAELDGAQGSRSCTEGAGRAGSGLRQGRGRLQAVIMPRTGFHLPERAKRLVSALSIRR